MWTCTEQLFATERTDKIITIIIVYVPVRLKELIVVY